VEAVLADPAAAPIGEPLRATLALLDRLTLEPESFGPADVAKARAAGASRAAIADAIAICALFNMIDRCADALGFVVAPGYDGRRLLEHGYA
jgi:alkylhydroperoxidase family enzyme